MVQDTEMFFRLAELFDSMQGVEAQVMHRRFLAEHSHAQISKELGLSEQQSIEIAASGLRRVKNEIFNT